jgi:hypothetical protein
VVAIGAIDSRERAIADSQFGGGVTTWAPATWFAGLSYTTPATDGTNFTEPVGGAYARVSITNNATNWPAAATSSGVTTKANGTAITWPNPTATWAGAATPMTHIGLFVALTGGSPEYWFKLDTPIQVNNGNTPVQIDIGQFIMAWGV